MNIGMIKKTAAGQLIGTVATLAATLTVGLRPVTSNNPKAPKFDVMVKNGSGNWIVAGALFELTASNTGEVFYQGKIDDPSFASPLYVALFGQNDGGYAVAWRRPVRRDARLGNGSPDGETFDFGGDPTPDMGGDGLGESTAPGARGRAKSQRQQAEAGQTRDEQQLEDA